PFLAGRHRELTRIPVAGDPERRDLDHGAVEALVGDHQVAAATEDEHRLASRVRGPDGIDEVVLGLGADEGPGRPAQAGRGEVSQPHARRTVARARVSTFLSPDRAVTSTVTRLPSSLPVTTPETSRVAPLSSSGTTTGAENLTPYSVTAAGSPAHSVR